MPQKIAEILRPYEGIVPGCALMVIQNGSPSLIEVRGCADLESGTPVTKATNFRLCSVSKQFTATAILKLVASGNVSLEDPLSRFFPKFPEYGRMITIRQLLAHTSGLLDYEDLMERSAVQQIHDSGVLELLMRQEHGYFAPGSAYRYSNGGYCLLALIVERVSADPFSDFARSELFLPLGMTQTFVNEEGVTTITNRAYGYSRDGGGWLRTDQNATSATIGDGGIYSSLNDLALWDRELDSLNLFTPQVLTDEQPASTHYGFGYLLKEHNGLHVQYHGGDSIGFRTGIYRVSERQTTIVFLSNRNESEGSSICEQIFDAAINSAPTTFVI